MGLSKMAELHTLMIEHNTWDDVFLDATQPELLMRFVNCLRSTFTISAEGPIETFLNICITRDIPTQTVNLCMSAYMEIHFQKFNMVPNSTISTPI